MLEIVSFFDMGCKQQVAFNLDALERATGRKLSFARRAELVEQQHQALRWTYLGSGLRPQEIPRQRSAHCRRPN